MQRFDAKSIKAIASRVKKPHLGKKPMKFYLTCHDITLDLRRPLGEVFIVWRRGRKVVVSKPVKVDEVLDPVDGSLTVTATFKAQDLALLCTIFLDKERNSYDPKMCEFALHESTLSGPRELAVASLDLSRYASAETTRTQLELPLPASGTLGTLKLTLVTRWLRTFAVGDGDDAGSLFSAVTTNSSEGGYEGMGGAAAGSLDGADEYQNALESLKEHMDAGDEEELERDHKQRAIEDHWRTHMAIDPKDLAIASGPRGIAAAAELTLLREVVASAHAETTAAHAEVKRLQTVLSKVGDHHKVALAQRVTDLEKRLLKAERERVEIEELLAAAFTQVITALEHQLAASEDQVGRLRAQVANRSAAARAGGARVTAPSGAGRGPEQRAGNGYERGDSGGGGGGWSSAAVGASHAAAARPAGGCGGGGGLGLPPELSTSARGQMQSSQLRTSGSGMGISMAAMAMKLPSFARKSAKR
ncbi:hypothetical protein T492DRAFT_1068144 [Pavlovales sp. CCMP2436]|nr:hypothetical protein T492DRAFT_1068144 [Pavlovales sp. CCMP2436]|mmetsp:Transcript_25414/g.64596  ORF Transcript_25414/g.64596 Transcript_25414/m.64596 type:complete len:475 (-) Transcript_25414:106-1530(-)